MLVKVKTKDLKLGMHLKELCGSWLEHPFWRSSFLLEDPLDLKRIWDSSVEEAWIDISTGLAPEAGVHSETAQQAEDRADKALAAFDSDPAQGMDLAARRRIAAPKASRFKPCSVGEEAGKAAIICHSAKQAVKKMFSEVRMGKAMDARDALPLVEEISDSVARNPGAIISVARLKTKDEYTYMHSVAVCALMVALARQMGMDDKGTRLAGLAGLLHDIGKIAIPSDVLNKPSALTDIEFAMVKAHPAAGHEMLSRSKEMPPEVLDVCLRHHEKVDGTGYPGRLKGDEISLMAKMGAVCDVYDAITSDRPYKKGWGPAEAVRKMAEWSKSHFDEKIFQAFVKSVGIYPTGSLVKLESKRLAVVCDQGPGSLLHPVVKVFYSIRSQNRIVPELLDLGKSKDKIVSRELPSEWGFEDLDSMWRS